MTHEKTLKVAIHISSHEFMMFCCSCFLNFWVLRGAESLKWLLWNYIKAFSVCLYCWRVDRKMKIIDVESVGLAEALSFLSVISIDCFLAWLIRIRICYSKYHVYWENARCTWMILFKRLTQYPFEKQMGNLFMTDWCCWCAAAAYTYKKALLLLILPLTKHVWWVMQCYCKIMCRVAVHCC